MPLPLDGILVADFSRVLAGPLCTQLLGDEGARVVKVEEPRRGDETRRWGPPFEGDTATYFLSINRNKESLAVDLRTEEGSALAKLLIARSDVVVDNFLPSQRAALGLEDVLTLNPRAVHCSIAGYDGDTAEANTPGYDLLAQAGAGLMAITGDPAGEPTKTGVALSDVLTAHYAHGAICAALYARGRTGRGARIEVSLFSATLASMINVAQGALMTGEEARRYGNAHPSIVPYQVFHASDRPFAIGGGTDRHFRLLCERVIARPELARDERFVTNAGRVTNRDVLIPLLEGIFRVRPAAEWVARCREVSIPASLVQGVLEALRSEAAQPLIDERRLLRNPVRFDGERFPIRTAPPLLGEQTDALVNELTFAAAIFDFDETIIDLEPQHAAAHDALCREMGSSFDELPDSIRLASGRRIIDDIRDMRAYFRWTEAEDELFARRQRHFEEACRTAALEPMPGVREVVRALRRRGIPLAITSSAVREAIETILERLGLRDDFALIVDGSEVRSGKPDPEAYLLTARRLAVEPSRCVVFEDSHVGVVAAKRAGMFCIAVRNPRAQTVQDLSAADIILDNMSAARSLFP
jgi:HAD superfamily hydrolase (TIGR01509 family)